MLRSFTSDERRALFGLAAITAITRLALAFRPEWRIATRPYIDDAFYIFNVCYHLAHGSGLSADGIHLTNGIQPLVTFLYAPFFAIAGSDKVLALRLCFIVAAIVDVLAVFAIATLVRELRTTPEEERSVWLRSPILGALAWTLLYPILVHSLNGLETGLYSLFILLSIFFYVRLRAGTSTPTTIRWIGFGALLGLTVLARIDGTFLVAGFALTELMRYKREGFRNAMIFGITAIIVSSPWWIYNYTVFGSIMPQSGQSEAVGHVLEYNIPFALSTLANMLTVFFFLPKYGFPFWFHYAWFATALLLTAVVWKKTNASAYLKANMKTSALMPLAIQSVGLIIYYIFFFSAPYFLERYFQPIRILWLLAVLALAPKIISTIRSYALKNRIVTYATVWLVGLAGLAFSILGYGYHFFIPKPNDLYQATIWAEQHPSLKIGMGQSGIASFFAPNVTNLDGKVNPDALKAIQGDSLGAYVKRVGFDYINDWVGIAEPILRSAQKFGAEYAPVDTIERVIVYKRITP